MRFASAAASFIRAFAVLPGLIGGFFHAGQEEAHPRFPIAGEADGLQEVVVLLAVLREAAAEIRTASRAMRLIFRAGP